MKKKRFAVKVFSVMMVLCLMVGLSAALDCCLPIVERYEPSRSNSSALCVPRDWVQALPYNACRFAGGLTVGMLGVGLADHPRIGVPAVAGVNELARIICKPVEEIKLYWEREACTPAPNNDKHPDEV